ncbi:hypothetical protein GCM10022221_68210 [Actinocorallia aurea]
MTNGGAYDFVYNAAEDGDLVGREKDIRAVAERLEELGHRQVASVTRGVLRNIARAKKAAMRLTDVWAAVEWLDSGTAYEEDVARTARDFRAGLGLPQLATDPSSPPKPGDPLREAALFITRSRRLDGVAVPTLAGDRDVREFFTHLLHSRDELAVLLRALADRIDLNEYQPPRRQFDGAPALAYVESLLGGPTAGIGEAP